MAEKDDIAKGVEKGIKTEKAKESIAVFMTLGVIGISIFFATVHWILGITTLLGGLFGVWKYYMK